MSRTAGTLGVVLAVLITTAGSTVFGVFSMPTGFDETKVQGEVLNVATVRVGEVKNCWFKADDADGDSLKWQSHSPPSGVVWTTSDASTLATYTWTPTATQIGVHYIVCSFSDGEYQTFATEVVEVIPANRAPTIRFGCGAVK